jgi:hypothetical protein
MTRLHVLLVGVLVLLTVVARDVRAQTSEQGSAFVKEMVEAINGKSPERRKALLHPASLPCTRGEAGVFYDEAIARQARRTVSTNYTWKITPLSPDQPLMFADKLDYPVRPTHLLQLDFTTGPNSSATMVLQLVSDRGRWREVMPCPKPETLTAIRAARDARAKHAERVEALAASASLELKETVIKLFKEGRRIEAYKHYAGVTGEELATAKAVVDLLASAD